MKSFKALNKEELLGIREELNKAYLQMQAKGLHLDMSRGKPAPAQLELSMGILDVINSNSVLQTRDGFDCRNYGLVDGIEEAKKLMGEMIGVDEKHVMVYGNASLSIMYDAICRSVTHGVLGNTPWSKLEVVKFICPVPGYDRHFSILENFGIEMVTVPMLEDGPDMDMVEKLVQEDEYIKGIWCVPKYANPTGISYSDEVVRRFAQLTPAAKDFRIYWDNAYVVHHLYQNEQAEILEILRECEKAGNPNLVLQFCSTSKVTFAGGGIAAVACSLENLAWFKKSKGIKTIGYDKINMLRHVLFLKDIQGIRQLAIKQAEIMRPKFQLVLDILCDELEGTDTGTWTNPLGGYFISFEANEGCAKKIVAKCKEAGMVLTAAGSTFPYGIDPKDSNIRIAPTYPTLEEMQIATKLFTLCVKLVSVEQILEN